MGLYEHYLKEEETTLRFQAAIHGAKLKEGVTQKQEQEPKRENLDQEFPLFGDPNDYDSMTQEERVKLTEKMMGKHRVWAGQAFKVG